MTAYGYIYVVTNRTSGKSYVGQTTQKVASRWRQHQSRSAGGCRVLVAALRKYGPSDFDVITVDMATDQDGLNRKERHWIAKLRTIAPGGYNLEDGGANGKPSPETRRRLSEAHKGIVPSAATRERMRETQKARRAHEKASGDGPVFTKASREAMARAQRGTKHSAETKQTMSLARTGKSLSEETREKIRNKAKGREVSDETRDKLRKAQTGKTHSLETRQKMSAAGQGRRRPQEVVEKVAAANRGKKRSAESRRRMSDARKAYLQRRNEAQEVG